MMAWRKKRKRKKSAVFNNIQHHQQYGNVNYEKCRIILKEMKEINTFCSCFKSAGDEVKAFML